MKQSPSSLDWPTIIGAGRELGLADTALEKWRERKTVPHKWRLPLIRHLGLPLDAFEKFLAEAEGV